MIPGEIMVDDGEIELNAGRATVTVEVANTGDRPIQVGSHYHFFEVNDALAFDRAAARGCRLNIAAGTAVRFEPGQTRTVTLVALAGARAVYGFAGRVMGPLDQVVRAPRRKVAASASAKGRGTATSAGGKATSAKGKATSATGKATSATGKAASTKSAATSGKGPGETARRGAKR